MTESFENENMENTNPENVTPQTETDNSVNTEATMHYRE